MATRFRQRGASGRFRPAEQERADAGLFERTTIVGDGRYGNNYIGPKYAKSGYPWQAVAVVDPHLTRGRFAVSVLGRRRPDCLLFRSFQEWYDGYFAQLTPIDARARYWKFP